MLGSATLRVRRFKNYFHKASKYGQVDLALDDARHGTQKFHKQLGPSLPDLTVFAHNKIFGTALDHPEL